MWRIHNPDSVPHDIVGLAASCVCTRVTLTGPTGTIVAPATGIRVPVAPGEELEVTVEIDPSHIRGEVVGTVSVTTDDAQCPTFEIALRGEILDALVIDPAEHDLGEISPAMPVGSPFWSDVRRLDDAPFRIVDVFDSPPGFQVDYHAVADDRREWRIVIQTTGLRDPGPFWASVRFRIDTGETGVLRLKGRVTEAVQFVPEAMVVLGIIFPGASKTAVVGVTAQPGSRLGQVLATWRDEASSPARVGVTITEENESHAVVQVAVVAPQGHQAASNPPGRISGWLRLEVPDHHLVREIAVWGFVRDPRPGDPGVR